MAEPFGTARGDWAPYCAALSGIAATLLGLLFVSVSLRLNLFRDAEIADVRDFATLIFGQYLTVVVMGLLTLFPRAPAATLGGTALVLSALNLTWVLITGRQYLRLNPTRETRAGWALLLGAGGLATTAALMGSGLLLLTGDAVGALPWLAGTELAMLVSATVGAWVLLTHARPS
ncbi:MAG: hypothetical protein AB7R89_22480 [Dehalococcoidia bacterium]